jgi:hypothetical protein
VYRGVFIDPLLGSALRCHNNNDNNYTLKLKDSIKTDILEVGRESFQLMEVAWHE